MKKNLALNLWMFLGLLFAHNMIAQYDDIYYNPDEDEEFVEDYDFGDDETYASNEDDFGDDWDGEEYDHFDDYDYHYSSRIRRFHRPYRGFNYYDPCYVDLYYYDPFYRSYDPFLNTTIYLSFGNFYSSRNFYRWNRYNNWNRWNFGWSGSWGNNPYNSWNRYDRWNRYGNGSFGWNRNVYGGGYGYNGFRNPNYCPTGYAGNPYGYNRSNGTVNQRSYGSRRLGSTKVNPNTRRSTSKVVRTKEATAGSGVRGATRVTRETTKTRSGERLNSSGATRTKSTTRRSSTSTKYNQQRQKSRSNSGTYRAPSSNKSNKTYSGNRKSGSSSKYNRPSRSSSGSGYKPSGGSRSSKSYSSPRSSSKGSSTRSGSSRGSSRSSGSSRRGR